MKTLKLMFVAAFVFAATMQGFAQQVLREITVTASNYRYLNALEPEEAAQPVNMLQQYAATYDVKSAGFYEEENENYFVAFYIPDGKILAAYDVNGKLERTAEKFKNVAIPKDVRDAIARRFPKWAVAKDVYRVSYYDDGGATTSRMYKVVLENGDKRMRVKLSESGEFL